MVRMVVRSGPMMFLAAAGQLRTAPGIAKYAAPERGQAVMTKTCRPNSRVIYAEETPSRVRYPYRFQLLVGAR